MRQIVLDTETTGLETAQGHRIIEIGCVELLDRRLTGSHYHRYLNPDREVEAGAIEVHGISNEFLADKPRFEEIVDEFLNFVKGSELVIHNAAFDVEFIDYELSLLAGHHGKISDYCGVVDTLALARARHPSQKNSLDALCKRYSVDNSTRDLHGALLDAEILADVYLRMTGGQTNLALSDAPIASTEAEMELAIRPVPGPRQPLRVICANEDELARHRACLEVIAGECGGPTLWEKSTECADS